MDPNSVGGGGGGGSSSSDFVRKLYKMLEDPSHRAVVRWSDTGDSFIVVDTNDFTKNILPQHFKHSNFASFVRQLNKSYDFHKIRNNEEASQYGEQAWEFKHPDFTMHNKDNLDNIRRKAPATRKQQHSEDSGAQQRIEDLQNRFRAMSDAQSDMNTRMQQLQEQNQSLMQQLQELLAHHHLQLRMHNAAIGQVLSCLQAVDANMRSDGEGVSLENGAGTGATDSHSIAQNGFSASLRQAQTIIDHLAKFNSPQSEEPQHASPPQPGGYESYGAVGRNPQNGQRSNAAINGMHSVQTPGPPMYGPGTPGMSEMYDNGQGGPSGYQMNPQHNADTTLIARPQPGRKRSTPFIPNWSTPPRVLLVEDDPTCARIGSKFLASAQCGCDLASDGLIAINQLNQNKYDLVLMDIVMPNLDGCSAANLIRQFDKETPIIAMTSNIRRDDITSYFQHGMNDVLPKPFTKEGLLTMLERMLGHLKAGKSSHQQIPPQLNFNTQETRMIENDSVPKTATSMKFSTSPAPSRSPGTAGLYGSGRSPTDMGEENVGQTPSTVEDSGYIHMMGPYIDNNGNHHNEHGSGFPSPANSARGRRRGASEMADTDDQMTYVKKQRY